MKWFLKKVAPFLLIAISAIWLGYQYYQSPKSVNGAGFQPVTPISKLHLSDVEAIRSALLDPDQRGKFNRWEKKVANNLQVIMAEVRDGREVYTIFLLPDLLQVRHSPSENSKRTVILDDYDFDGTVDYAVTVESGKNIRAFDLEKHSGKNFGRAYQALYEENTALIASKLGL